jgi:hypothetical protein
MGPNRSMDVYWSIIRKKNNMWASVDAADPVDSDHTQRRGLVRFTRHLKNADHVQKQGTSR